MDLGNWSLRERFHSWDDVQDRGWEYKFSEGMACYLFMKCFMKCVNSYI